MLSLNLTPIFKARGIERPYSFLVKAGLTSHVAHAILSSETRSFRLDHIELLCRALICEPSDLVLYTPDKNHPLPQEHPLNNLKQPESVKDLGATLANMPFKQLKEIAKQISEGQ
ncbi:MAG: helix-turn-helix transcriptional regulator [Saprospiraceae bacterium]|nr:helix-turn-helix transcriptional regulator [Saprospiraceae bacterium]